MRSRNRKEKVYTAKCCGAPLSIRIAEGKAPHFVHQVTPESCDADRRETPEHRRLKHLIAETAIRTYEWDVETEARENDPATGRAVWQADVLALKKKAAVAFEVQLSNADYGHMLARQARYKQSGVRGLWLVKTKKGFPPSKALPVFTLDTTRFGDWVKLSTRGDFVDMWHRTEEADLIELPVFIEAVLNKQLKWAPFLDKPDTLLEADIGYVQIGTCTGCARKIVAADKSRLCVATEFGYPDYLWVGGFDQMYRTKWHSKIVAAVWQKVAESADVAFVNARNTCSWCQAPITFDSGPKPSQGTLSTRLRMGDLPKPIVGTVEWNWLCRWYVMGD